MDLLWTFMYHLYNRHGFNLGCFGLTAPLSFTYAIQTSYNYGIGIPTYCNLMDLMPLKAFNKLDY